MPLALGKRLRHLRVSLLISLLVMPFFSNAATASSNNLEKKQQVHEKLTSLQSAISQQKLNIKSVNKKRTRLEETLKQDDLAIAEIITQLNTTTQDKKTTVRKINTLIQEKHQLKQSQKQQEKILGQQLQAAYTTGHHDYLKLLLNQEKPGSVQRTITYYQYLNNARMLEIDVFKSTIVKLQNVEAAYNEQNAKLTLLAQKQTRQKKSLEKNKNERKKTLTLLSKELLNNQQKLEQLIAEEENLVSALNQLAKVAQAEVNLNGLGQLQRQLSWPVKGKISHKFGSRKQGYLKWKGVLVNAPEGKQVKTIHNGTVLFSDWLKGYGLVTVIDHGKGYMSLYGHNQALLKNVGDRVETGEPIALVGQSGGQLQSGLYFEIRHRGKAVNPKKWCK